MAVKGLIANAVMAVKGLIKLQMQSYCQFTEYENLLPSAKPFFFTGLVTWLFGCLILCSFLPAGDCRMCACPQTPDFAKVVLNKCVVMHSNDARTFN